MKGKDKITIMYIKEGGEKTFVTVKLEIRTIFISFSPNENIFVGILDP